MLDMVPQTNEKFNVLPNRIVVLLLMPQALGKVPSLLRSVRTAAKRALVVVFPVEDLDLPTHPVRVHQVLPCQVNMDNEIR